LLFTKNT
jgi:hypothetical protein